MSALARQVAARVPRWTAALRAVERAMGRAPVLYVASKVHHGEMWRDLRARGLPVRASWLDAPGGMLSQARYADLWTACVEEAAAADAVLLYARRGEVLKGCLVECGSCLAAFGLVLQIGGCESVLPGEGSDASFRHHPRWKRVGDADDVEDGVTGALIALEHHFALRGGK